MNIIEKFCVLSIACAALNGCATITTGSSQSITVETDPDGATCRLSRISEVVGAVNPTPGSVVVDKSMSPITISCDLRDHLTANAVMRSNFQGATLGNVILGGGIGLIVDAGSGAMNQYPTFIELDMIPASFSNESARDEFFSAKAKKLNVRFDALAKKDKDSCSGDDCIDGTGRIEKERKSALVSLHAQKSRTIVKGAQ